MNRVLDTEAHLLSSKLAGGWVPDGGTHAQAWRM